MVSPLLVLRRGVDAEFLSADQEQHYYKDLTP